MCHCNICDLTFRDSYNLKRHLSGSKHKNKEDSEFKLKNYNLDSNKELNLKNNYNLDSTTCGFCLNTFSTTYYKIKHELICKLKDDPIRKLELCQNIDIKIPESKTECRFCNKDLSRVGNLNRHLLICKEREIYHSSLLTQNNQKINQTINHGTINNVNGNQINNNNNITIINLGDSPKTDHITVENVLEMYETMKSSVDPTHTFFIKAGKMVVGFDKLISQNPENNNIIIPNERSMYAEVKKPNGWEKEDLDEALNICLKNSAKELFKQKNLLEKHDIVLTNKSKFDESNTIFDNVKKFSEIGFSHHDSKTSGTISQRKLKKALKLGKLKNKLKLA